MGNLMSCVLICGAVEVVHVVRSDGHVERLIRPLDSSKIRKNFASKRQEQQQQLDVMPPRADLMKCLSSLGKNTTESNGGGHSYLLLPISNADDATGGAFHYKRLSSFQFYKSAFLSPMRSTSTSSSSTSSASKSLVKATSSGDKNGKVTRRSSSSSSSSSGSGEHEDRKLLLKDSCQQQQPFKVKQEGGVTKLVVSKKYLQQLLLDSNTKKSSSTTTAHHQQQQHDHRGGGGGGGRVSSSVSHQKPVSTSPGAAPPRVGRPGIWRPALESISEAAAAAAVAGA